MHSATLSRLAVLGLTALALPAFAPAAVAGPPATLQTYRIDDWKAVSNTELVIRANNGRRYRAVLLSPCFGLRFTDRIAFLTRGERAIDRFAGIQLPDGTRCLFKSFEAISSPADSRDPAH